MPELKPTGKIIARGQSGFSVLSTGVDIAFDRPMPEGSTYKVFYRQISGVNVGLPSTSNQTPTGFRASVGIGVAAQFEWLVIED
jgi:hypothetical protein